VLIDAFLIPGMMRQKRDELRQRMMTEMMALGTGPAAATAPGPAAVQPPAPPPAIVQTQS
jgi:hypothetical protein